MLKLSQLIQRPVHFIRRISVGGISQGYGPLDTLLLHQPSPGIVKLSVSILDVHNLRFSRRISITPSEASYSCGNPRYCEDQFDLTDSLLVKLLNLWTTSRPSLG